MRNLEAVGLFKQIYGYFSPSANSPDFAMGRTEEISVRFAI